MDKPTLPKGTRDFGPATMAKRQFIFNKIRSVFQKYGFQPLETPAMENLSTLTGKYGEEGDQLLFRIQDSEDFLDKKHSFAIANAGVAFRELFDRIDHSIGAVKVPNAKNEQEVTRLRMAVNSQLGGLSFNDAQLEAQLPLEEFARQYSEWIVDAMIEWYNKSPIKDDLDWWKNRNGAVSALLSRFLRDRVSDKGLRYDLTVPFARYVVMNRNDVSFPFKRYQIQPVWRADKPQRGRYREFYQCDADVVGTDSLICEAEILLMIKDVFSQLGITDYTIKMNHRGVLNGIAEVIGAKGNEMAMFVAIDKLDKIGEEKVKEELRGKGFEEEGLTRLFTILNAKGTNKNKIAFLAGKFETSPAGQKGLRDITEVFQILQAYGSSDDKVEFDVSLARGLSYYTGCIFEVKINNVGIGSVSGGGRYDNLTQAFGDKDNLSGVGFSFGVDRIYDAMEELKIFPANTQISSQVLVCHFDDESRKYGIGVLAKLRDAGVSAEIYPDIVKIKKQLEFANKKMIPFTVVIGSDEMANGQLACKNMNTGGQEKLTVEQIIAKVKQSS